MKVSHLVADYFQTQLESSDHADIAVSISDGDNEDPARVNIVWREDVDPVSPPLHLYDLEYEVRTGFETDLTVTDHNDVAEWVKDQLTAGTLAALTTALAGVGTVNDWFVGESGGTDRLRTHYITQREIRLAVVHG